MRVELSCRAPSMAAVPAGGDRHGRRAADLPRARAAAARCAVTAAQQSPGVEGYGRRRHMHHALYSGNVPPHETVEATVSYDARKVIPSLLFVASGAQVIPQAMHSHFQWPRDGRSRSGTACSALRARSPARTLVWRDGFSSGAAGAGRRPARLSAGWLSRAGLDAPGRCAVQGMLLLRAGARQGGVRADLLGRSSARLIGLSR